MLKKLMLVLGGLALIIILLLGAGYYYIVKLPLPRTGGELKIKGLIAPVKIYRDPWGVPHIFAENMQDLFFAQGFVQAQDRLWQMETNRRLAAGRLSEIIGPGTIEMDRLLRTFGFMRAAKRELESYDNQSLEILQAFSKGVNAFTSSRGSNLPLEFRLLGVRPEPWRPEDSLAWAKVMALLGGKNWQEEVVRGMLIQKLGKERADDLLGRLQPGTPAIIPSGMNLTALWPNRDYLKGLVFPVGGGASNNWVVHGSRTDTGLPLLANDMHLLLRIPSVWYEMHLVSKGIDVMGLSLAGVPLVIAGHNRDLAWGITFAYTDVQDLFLERFNTEKEGEYLYREQWFQAKIIEEPIRVKGQEKPVSHQVWKTRHGPIISRQVPESDGLGYALALKWSAHDPGGMLPTLFRLNRAKNWEEFKSVAQEWPEPAMNLVYADREGNIGYVLAGRVPLRRQGHGRGPFPGWTGESEWTGYLASDKKPSVLNPPRGFLVTANNQVTGPEYPYYLAVDYASGFRAARIEEEIARMNPISKGDFRVLQGDLKSLEATNFMSSLKGIEVKSPEARDLLDRLRSWDRVLDPDSVGGAIYSVLFYYLMVNTFQDELGEITDKFFGIGMTPLEPINRFVEHSRVILQGLMVTPGSRWFDDIRTTQRENLNQILEKSLDDTVAFLLENIGPDSSTWRWGRLHHVEIQHPLGSRKPLDRIFNLGPYEGGGHFSTVWQSAVMPGTDFNLKGWTASNRHIYDLKDWDRSLGTIVPGQSGMFGSPHYDDQMELWLRVDHHPLYYSRGKVESEAKGLLILEPG